jgi:hypothetical protein
MGAGAATGTTGATGCWDQDGPAARRTPHAQILGPLWRRPKPNNPRHNLHSHRENSLVSFSWDARLSSRLIQVRNTIVKPEKAQAVQPSSIIPLLAATTSYLGKQTQKRWPVAMGRWSNVPRAPAVSHHLNTLDSNLSAGASPCWSLWTQRLRAISLPSSRQRTLHSSSSCDSPNAYIAHRKTKFFTQIIMSHGAYPMGLCGREITKCRLDIHGATTIHMYDGRVV